MRRRILAQCDAPNKQTQEARNIHEVQREELRLGFRAGSPGGEIRRGQPALQIVAGGGR